MFWEYPPLGPDRWHKDLPIHETPPQSPRQWRLAHLIAAPMPPRTCTRSRASLSSASLNWCRCGTRPRNPGHWVPTPDRTLLYDVDARDNLVAVKGTPLRTRRRPDPGLCLVHPRLLPVAARVLYREASLRTCKIAAGLEAAVCRSPRAGHRLYSSSSGSSRSGRWTARATMPQRKRGKSNPPTRCGCLFTPTLSSSPVPRERCRSMPGIFAGFAGRQFRSLASEGMWDALRSCASIRSLRLCGVELDAPALEMLAGMKNLEALSLFNCGFSLFAPYQKPPKASQSSRSDILHMPTKPWPSSPGSPRPASARSRWTAAPLPFPDPAPCVTSRPRSRACAR
ncbi:hypothetical protein DFJ74DRAFT_675243 [Hyaloraphidium curvatum]|nr:hypothetical protein DFJ74DRAFT_675243 [Hyaloraphidium curvatum]